MRIIFIQKSAFDNLHLFLQNILFSYFEHDGKADDVYFFWMGFIVPLESFSLVWTGDRHSLPLSREAFLS